jgi:hypothetical protein
MGFTLPKHGRFIARCWSLTDHPYLHILKRELNNTTNIKSKVVTNKMIKALDNL